jgi:hypothetical protein
MTFEDFTKRHGLRYKCRSGIGDGWVPIVDRLFTDLRALGFNGTDVAQIKEKFGGLRVYIDGATEELRERIGSAEEQCWRTCEECGNSGVLAVFPNGARVQTLCANHQAAVGAVSVLAAGSD